jgi:hypothetical protein
MKTFRKTILLVSLFIGIVLPTQFVFAAECWCGLKNTDCSVIPLTGSDCNVECTNTYKENFEKILFGDIGSESVCTIKHNVFLAKEADAKKAAAATTATPSTPPKSSITPTLNVEIPGLTFSPAVISASTVKSNFLADYINAIYLFLIGTGVVFVIIMVMIGGLQYTIGAGSEAQIGKGKERIRNAITGLVLLLCTFLILKTTNPQLVTMKMLELQNVLEEGLGNNEAVDPADATANYPSVSITAGQLPQFKQCAGGWKSTPYKGANGALVTCGPNKHNSANHEDNICESGCGPTSTAVVLGYYGQNVSPPIVADFASSIGAHTSCSSGTNLAKLCDKIKSKWPDMTCKGLSPKNTGVIANLLTQKKPIVFSCHKCTGIRKDGSAKTYKGHFMVLTGVSGNNFTVFDVGSQNGIISVPISEFVNDKIGSTYLIEKK